MVRLSKYLWLICAILFLSTSFVFAANEEEITIATYYPSPYGVYKDLTTQDTLAVGSTARAWLNPLVTGSRDGLIVAGGVNGGLFFKSRNNANTFALYAPDENDARIWSQNDGDLFYINAVGKLSIKGRILQYKNTDTRPNGCIMMTYGGNSGTTHCPANTTADIGTAGTARIPRHWKAGKPGYWIEEIPATPGIPGLSPVASEQGGEFWCCS